MTQEIWWHLFFYPPKISTFTHWDAEGNDEKELRNPCSLTIFLGHRLSCAESLSSDALQYNPLDFTFLMTLPFSCISPAFSGCCCAHISLPTASQEASGLFLPVIDHNLCFCALILWDNLLSQVLTTLTGFVCVFSQMLEKSRKEKGKKKGIAHFGENICPYQKLRKLKGGELPSSSPHLHFQPQRQMLSQPMHLYRLSLP